MERVMVEGGTEALQSNSVYPPPVFRGLYFRVSGAADKRYSLGGA
jgi:hypothetical protein